MYRGETISLERKTLLLAIFCLLFIAIGGVAASDVADMTNNPDNNNLVSDSDGSAGNLITDHLSDEDVSSDDLTEVNNLNKGKENADVSSKSMQIQT